jgi:hypothetical protein
VGLKDLPQRPIGDALSVREASSLTPGGQVRPGIDIGTELGDDPALAEPGFAHDRDELNRARSDRLVEDAPQDREVDLAADERAVVGAGEVGAEVRPGGLRVEDPDWLSLALEDRRLQLFVVEDGRGRLVRGEPNRDAHLRGDRLDPRRGVDRIAGEEPLSRARGDPQADERLAIADPDPEAERGSTD